MALKIDPRVPLSPGWTEMPECPLGRRFTHDSGVLVISEVLAYQNKPAEYHLSITVRGQRPDDHTVDWVREEFKAHDFVEENHGIRATRNLWKKVPIEALSRDEDTANA